MRIIPTIRRKSDIAAIGAVATLMLGCAPTLAASKLFYGSRAGMEVTVISKSGLDTGNAVILTRHTREDAVAFCREYVRNVTPACIRDELAQKLNGSISANCLTGVFVDFWGDNHRFLGPNTHENSHAKYAIANLPSGELADGSSASGYPVNLDIFRALCPARAPSPGDEYKDVN